MKEIASEQEWQKISEIFLSIVELPEEKRSQALSEIDNARARQEVEKLLIADGEDNSFLQDSPLAAVNLTGENLKMPEQIGKYKILREIGRGGMGAVYLATREDLKKQVALKIIKRGMDTDEILRRFQTERQILANLEHPNIARLLDGGVSDEGLPFLVMEYIAGEDLMSYCEDPGLSLTVKLNLFRKICAAVGYAHRNLVVHRDLKPSNILVSKDGEPKLLDFGISKLLSNETDETGTATALGMMTPNYASPEQFRGETVSTATDIYSLGVILFELLTGELPYKIKSKRFEEAARIIAESEPLRPSAIEIHKTQNGNRQPEKDYKFYAPEADSGINPHKTKNQNQNTRSHSIVTNPKLLRGDLDNIILKALRKEPARRYSTVEQFSEDIRRHLDGLPVTARPDTFSYRAEKFIRRNKLPVIGSGLMALALIGGIVGTSWQAVRAERQRALAEKRFGEVRQMANNVVFKYYEEAEKITGSTKMRQMMLADAVSYLDSLSQDAAGDASLQKEVGLAYMRIGKVQGEAYFANLGDTKSAVENYQKGIKMLEPLALETNDTKLQWDFVNAVSQLSSVLRRQGNIAESDQYLKRTIELNEQFLAANPEDPTLLTRSAYNYYFLGDTLPLGKGENENISAFLKCQATAEKVLSKDPNHLHANNILAAATQRLFDSLMLMAQDAEEMGDQTAEKHLIEEAGANSKRAIEIGEKLVALQPNDQLYEGILTAAKFNVNAYFIKTKDYQAALHIALEGMENYEAKLKADPDNVENKLNTTYVYNSLSVIYLRLNDWPKAEENYRKMSKLFDELIAHDVNNLDSREKRRQASYIYADELLRAGKIDEAREIYINEFKAVENFSRETNENFAASVRGLMLEKIADCDFASARQPNLTAEKQHEFYQAALNGYQKALELWTAGGAQISPGVTDAKKVEVVKKHIDVCLTAL